MNREQIIETMARAACEHVYPNCDFAPEGSVWVSTWARERKAFEEQASAALSALEAARMVVVSVEMLDLADQHFHAHGYRENGEIRSMIRTALFNAAQGGEAMTEHKELVEDLRAFGKLTTNASAHHGQYLANEAARVIEEQAKTIERLTSDGLRRRVKRVK
jgi:hypothetical protein